MKQIILTQGEFALVDDEDYEYLNHFKWYCANKKKLKYVQRRAGKKTEYLHHLLLKPQKGQVIDHINRNGLDNRKSNLRITSRHQNTWNIDLPITNNGERILIYIIRKYI